MRLRQGRVLCAGNICHDILVRPVSEVRWGASLWVDDVDAFLGGNGANTSFALGRLGVPVRLLGMVGQDPFGEFCLAQLTSAGVDLSGLGRADVPTATTVGLVQPDGTRMFLHRRGASLEAFRDLPRLDEEARQGATHFHLANLFPLPHLRAAAATTLRQARDAGMTTSLDTGWDPMGEWMRAVEPCLPWVDVFFVNGDELRMLAGTEAVEAGGRRMISAGAGLVVVKLAGDGCAVFSREQEWREAAFRVQAVDSTGAGDCFAGGFLAALWHGMTLRQASRFANAVGALCVQSLGATVGLRSYEETLRWVAAAGC